MVNLAANALTNVFMSEMFHQIDYWLNYNQFRLAVSISKFICEIYLMSVSALQCSFEEKLNSCGNFIIVFRKTY